MKSEAGLSNIAHDDRDICTLSPEQLSERLELIGREIEPSAIARSELPDGGIAWEFERNAEIRAKLERLAEEKGEAAVFSF